MSDIARLCQHISELADKATLGPWFVEQTDAFGWQVYSKATRRPMPSKGDEVATTVGLGGDVDAEYVAFVDPQLSRALARCAEAADRWDAEDLRAFQHFGLRDATRCGWDT